MSETQHTYTPAVAIDSHDLTPCVLCGGIMVTCGDLDLCSSCGSRWVRSQAKAAAAIDLLPCPWCGTVASLFYELGAVECGACACRGPSNEKERVARAEWNRRAGAARDASLRALFDEMIGGLLSDHDDFEGIASGRLPATVNQGRDTWRVARGYQERLDKLLREGSTT